MRTYFKEKYLTLNILPNPAFGCYVPNIIGFLSQVGHLFWEKLRGLIIGISGNKPGSITSIFQKCIFNIAARGIWSS